MIRTGNDIINRLAPPAIGRLVGAGSESYNQVFECAKDNKIPRLTPGVTEMNCPVLLYRIIHKDIECSRDQFGQPTELGKGNAQVLMAARVICLRA